MNPTYVTDGYKIGHKPMYPQGTSFVFSNFTPRSTRRTESKGITWVGLQGFIKSYLIEYWNTNFFQKSKEDVLKSYSRRINAYLGFEVEVDHIAELHDLGYLPIEIKSLPEGSLVPYKVAPMVIYSTHEKFYWLPNFLETILSASLWYPSTTATTARLFKEKFLKWANKTGGNAQFVDFQGHNFSMRGCPGLESSTLCDAAHLVFFKGTDTIPGIDYVEKYYNADCEKELIGVSVPASEHAVASLQIIESAQYPQEGDINYISNLMDVFPKGILSLVSDTFDYWGTITKTLPSLKDKIMARDGKVVIRPDSGDPVRIVAGYKGFDLDTEVEHGITINVLQEQGYEMAKVNGIWHEIVPGPRQDSDYELKATKLTDAEVKGSIVCLYEIFGGSKNEKGFIELDPHIGLIYGDGITLERVENISQRLADKGFASTNLVYGIGSYTYLGQVSRDTDGWAMKATAAVVNGKFIEIYKDPKTDTWGKKSAKGLIAVYEQDGTFVQKDQVTWDEVNNCAYRTVFSNGKLIVDDSLLEIRERASQTI